MDVLSYTSIPPPSEPSSLPAELLVQIFSYLPQKSLLDASEVCQNWFRASRTRTLWEDNGSLLLKESFQLVDSSLRKISELSRRSFQEKASLERFELLANTLEVTRQYIASQTSSSDWKFCRNPILVNALYKCLLKQLTEIDKMLEGISKQVYSMTCNFDILDFALRRLFEELKSLIPNETTKFDPPGPDGTYDLIPDPRIHEVIKDPDARVVWQTVIGSNNCCCPYDVFERKVISRCFPEALNSPRFIAHLKFHLNFPSTTIVTTYRFHVLLSQFGPFRKFAENFEHFALKPGFLGLINMIKAEELLVSNLQSLKNNTVLIRYSRKQPEVLAFTSIDLTSKRIEHRRNIDRAGKPIPISMFLDRVFPGYDLFKMGIDDSATKIPNSFTFARGSDAYLYSEFSVGSSNGSNGRLHRSHRTNSRNHSNDDNAAATSSSSPNRT